MNTTIIKDSSINPDEYFDKGHSFLVEKISYEKNHSMNDFHFHSCYELFFLLEGQRTYIVNQSTILVEQHDVLCIQPHAFHKSIGVSPYSRYVLYFNDAFLTKYFTSKALPAILNTLQQPLISVADSDFGELLRLLERLICFQQQKAELHFYLSFVALINLLQANMGSQREIIVPVTNKNYIAILQYINENFAHIQAISEIAEHFFITKYHLCRLFKEYTGTTLVRYLTDVRLKHACELLLNTHLSITEISSQCGFHTSMYFNNVFKRSLGMTPLAYRRK